MANRLANEQSPYLRQHAYDPVDWYSWGEEAFDKAHRENKPVFLSIGYSSCHWCHVMQRESFENEEIARVLNDRFVSVKVDREERPDIDRHFQEIFVTMNARAGGWPLSVFMTPEKIPLYAATYVPPEPRYGMMGFGELLETLARRWEEEPELIREKGREVLRYLEPKRKIEATRLNAETLVSTISKQLRGLYDPGYGGFGKAPKFPQASTLRLALDLYRLEGDESLRAIVEHTLDTMTLGGLYDLVEGGFCRYSTDERWLVPHFEKMTYDNALLSDLLVRASVALGKDRYRSIAFETLDFMLERMMQEDLFYSASDADTDGEEGGYFVYDYDEVLRAFEEAGIAQARAVARRLGMSPEGNFEGRNIPRLEDPDDREKPEIEAALKVLQELRKERKYPFIDRKIQTSWNAMMIRALFVAGRIEPRYARQAVRSLDRLQERMSAGVRLYHSALIGHEPKVEGFLEDYAWLCSALAEGYQSTLEERYLIRLGELANEAIRRFYVDGRWRIGDGEFRDFVDDFDSSYPSSLSVMTDALLSVRSLIDPVYEKFVYRTLEVHSYDLMRQPIGRPTLCEVSLRYLRDDLIVKAPRSLLTPHVAKRDALPYPWVQYRTAFGDAYELCTNHSCFAQEREWQGLTATLESWKSPAC